jgi:dienelactone hydrolase
MHGTLGAYAALPFFDPRGSRPAVTEVVLFHHALGLTEGVTAFAGDLRRAGHTVHTPDLYQGLTFGDLETGSRTPSRSGS